MKPGQPVLLIGGGRKYFVRAGAKDLHTDSGIFRLEELLHKEFGETIASHLGHELKARKPRAPDFFQHLKRTGAPISPKDVGLIVSMTGLNKEDRVLDAGTGSGILAIYLGLIAKNVVTYEIREDFAAVARSNIDLAGLDNVEVRNCDLLEEIRSIDGPFDIMTLDMYQAAELVPLVPPVLDPGGYLVVFTPFIEQAKDVRNAIHGAEFEDVITLENTQREISFSSRGTRPATVPVGHTGYITFARPS